MNFAIYLVPVLLGMSAGALAMWLWFHCNGLIRTRDEWEKAQRDKEDKP